MTAYDKEKDNISPPKKLTSQIEDRLVRDCITNELYMPLSSTIVLKQKKEMLYVPLDFENGSTIDAFVDSSAYVSATAQKRSYVIKQQAPCNIFEIDDLPNFPIQVANGQLAKPIATTLWIWYWRSNFCRNFPPNDEFDRVYYRVVLQETQQCGHWHYIWPHLLPTLDNESQKGIEWNEC